MRIKLLFSTFLLAVAVSPVYSASLTAECNSVHGIYIPGDEIKLTFTAKDVRRNDLTLDVRITDEYNRQLSGNKYPVQPDANGNWKLTVPANQKRLGMYRVYPRLSDGTTIPAILSRPKGCMTYAVLVDPARRIQYSQAESFFGLSGNTTDKLYPAYLGMSWRLDGGIPIGGRIWWQLEPNEPRQLEKRLHNKEKIVLANPEIEFKTSGGNVRWKTYGYFDLSYVPEWMRTEKYHKKDRAILGNRKFMNGPFTEEGNKEFLRICEMIAKMRTPLTPADEINLYEFFGEPHFPWNWQGTQEDLIYRYKIGSEVLKRHDPKAFVLGPCGAGLTPEYLAWYQELFNKGIGKYIDGVSIHPYPKGYPPESKNMVGLIRALKQMIRDGSGKDLPVFASELGFMFPGDFEGDLKQMRGFLRSNLILKGEGVRANYNFIMTNIKAEVDYSLIHNLNPAFPWGAPCSTPRAVCPALSALTWYLEGHQSAGPVDGLGKTGLGYVFERGSNVILAVWDYGEKPSNVEIPVGKDSITVADHMGNERVVKTNNGLLPILLTEDPQYILNVSPDLWGGKAFKHLNPETDVVGIVGSDLLLKGKMNAGKNPLSGSLSIQTEDGFHRFSQSMKVDLPSGGQKEYLFRLPIPMTCSPGIHEVKMILEDKGRILKSLNLKIQIESPVSIHQIVPFMKRGKYGLKMELRERSGMDSKGIVTVRLKGVPESRISKEFQIGANQKSNLEFEWDSLAWNPLKSAECDILLRRQDGYLSRINKRISMMKVPYVNSISIDGKGTEWEKIPFYKLSGRQFVVSSEKSYRGEKDISGEVGVAWNEKFLYFCFRVFDDVFCQPYTGIRTWEGDCLQIAFANPEMEESANRLAQAQTLKHVEYDFASTAKGDEVYRTISFDSQLYPAGNVNLQKYRLKTHRMILPDGRTEVVYEIAVPWETLAVSPEKNARLGWAFTINDRDRPEPLPEDCTRIGAFDLKKTDFFGTLIFEK